jgi:hypothetical protein
MGSFESWRRAARNNSFSRTLAVLLGGSLNQKVIVILGLAVVFFSLFWLISKLWQPMLLLCVGGVIVSLAVKDYERTIGRPM